MPEYESWVRYAPIPNFDGYIAGTDGSIWTSWGRISPGEGAGRIPVYAPFVKKWKRISFDGCKSQKYYGVSLSRAGRKRISQAVHILILRTFVGEKPPKLDGCHNNGDNKNNSLDNLRWATHVENCQDRDRHGRGSKGSRNGSAKTNESDVIKIREMFSRGVKRKIILDQFKISEAQYYRIVNKTGWKHI